MQPSPQMQQVITQLASKHTLDPRQRGASLRLQLPGYDLLVIQESGHQRVSIGHWFEFSDALWRELVVVLYVGAGSWLPVGLTYNVFGYQAYAQWNEARRQLVECEPRRQLLLVEFTERWAQQLINQAWLERGQRVR